MRKGLKGFLFLTILLASTFAVVFQIDVKPAYATGYTYDYLYDNYIKNIYIDVYDNNASGTFLYTRDFHYKNSSHWWAKLFMDWDNPDFTNGYNDNSYHEIMKPNGYYYREGEKEDQNDWANVSGMIIGVEDSASDTCAYDDVILTLGFNNASVTWDNKTLFFIDHLSAHGSYRKVVRRVVDGTNYTLLDYPTESLKAKYAQQLNDPPDNPTGAHNLHYGVFIDSMLNSTGVECEYSTSENEGGPLVEEDDGNNDTNTGDYVSQHLELDLHKWNSTDQEWDHWKTYWRPDYTVSGKWWAKLFYRASYLDCGFNWTKYLVGIEEYHPRDNFVDTYYCITYVYSYDGSTCYCKKLDWVHETGSAPHIYYENGTNNWVLVYNGTEGYTDGDPWKFDIMLEGEMPRSINLTKICHDTTGDIIIYNEPKSGEKSFGFAEGISATYATAYDEGEQFYESGESHICVGQVAMDGYFIDRPLMIFDTSFIMKESEISSAKLEIYGYQKNVTGSNFTLNVVEWTGNAVEGGIEEYTNYGNTSYGTLTSQDFALNAWNTINLDVTSIKKAQYTKLMIRSSRDIDSTAPTGEERIWFLANSTTPIKLELTCGDNVYWKLGPNTNSTKLIAVPESGDYFNFWTLNGTFQNGTSVRRYGGYENYFVFNISTRQYNLTAWFSTYNYTHKYAQYNDSIEYTIYGDIKWLDGQIDAPDQSLVVLYYGKNKSQNETYWYDHYLDQIDILLVRDEKIDAKDVCVITAQYGRDIQNGD
jgi:hypothetical protein